MIHYFRALIQKNWGDPSTALFEIEQSTKLLEKSAGEFLSPITRDELLLDIPGDEDRVRRNLRELLRRIDELDSALTKSGQGLNPNQFRLRSRMLVYLGNSYYVQDSYKEALVEYERAAALLILRYQLLIFL